MSQSTMRLVQGIVREDQVSAIATALERAGVPGMTVMKAYGRGRHAKTGSWRGGSYPLLLPMSVVQVIALMETAEDVARIIADHARTGEPGDGHVFVIAIEESQAVRTRWRNAS